MMSCLQILLSRTQKRSNSRQPCSMKSHAIFTITSNLIMKLTIIKYNLISEKLYFKPDYFDERKWLIYFRFHPWSCKVRSFDRQSDSSHRGRNPLRRLKTFHINYHYPGWENQTPPSTYTHNGKGQCPRYSYRTPGPNIGHGGD